jgi:hypothetical protein
MEDQPVVGFVYQVFGDMADELFFSLQWILCTTGQAQPGGNPEDMGVYGHIGLLVDH